MFLTVVLENLFLVKIFDKIHLVIVVLFVVALYLQLQVVLTLLLLDQTVFVLNQTDLEQLVPLFVFVLIVCLMLICFAVRL